MSCLVIVESAAKAATIQKYLSSLYPDRTWTVAASFGHIRDLPQKTLGVDTATWQVTYENLDRKKDVIAKLKKLSKAADRVYFAADPDLEGYAIAHHLRVTLKLPDSKCIRTTFNEITKTALKAAFDTPTGWNDSKVYAQETRRILDRIVGYKVSPLLWKAFKGESGLSAGRVQSAALNMLVERYTTFLGHTPAMSWTTHATFSTTLANHQLMTKEVTDNTLETLAAAKKHGKEIVKHATQHNTHTVSFSERTRAKHPPAPFTTSTLQRDAYTHLHKSPKVTMALAQALYEGGFITYMRTDATTLSNDAIAALSDYITTSIGPEYLATTPPATTKEKEKEGAHEAIRPTDVGRQGDTVSAALTADHAALYELIWKRTVASQMAPALYNDITYTIHVTVDDASPYTFKGVTSLMTFLGYMYVYGAAVDSDMQATWRTIIETTKCVELASVSAMCNVTHPHLLYNETDLVKAMEKNGIGRPSTYVSIIDKLQAKAYAAKGPGPSTTVKLTSMIWDDLSSPKTPRIIEDECVIGGTTKDRLVPTPLGLNIQKYLSENTPQLLDTTFTASMETNLDLIESEMRNKDDVLNEFYTPFQQVLDRACGTSTSTGTSMKHEAAFKKWLGVEDIQEDDHKGLARLPLNLPGGHTVLLGPYGIYTKSKGKNKKLDPSLWPKLIDGTLTNTDL